MLLNPKNSFEAECRKLKLDVSDTQPTKYFSCEDRKCIVRRSHSIIGMYYDTARCSTCGKTLKREVDVEESKDCAGGGGGVFTINTASFLISDDLRMVPNVSVSIMHTLTNLGIADTDGAELRTVTFGYDEIMDLLNGSLVSKTPLSDILLKQRQVEYFCGTPKLEHGLFYEKEKEATNSNSKKMNLRLMVQQSTNKLLFAQSEVDFIDFLCSLLTIPLGGVECLLSGKTCLKNIDNLYQSIADLIDNKYLAAPDMKNRLMQPKLPIFYVSKNQILPLSEQMPPRLYLRREDSGKERLSYSYHGTDAVTFRNGQGEYVKGPTMYMVRDDLTVTPLCMNSTLSLLNELKIPFYDIKEVEVPIGLEEALSILKASLTSTSALTDGLMNNPMLMIKN